MHRITVACIILPLILLGLTHLAAAQNVSIQLIPFNYPIVIPSSGGSFEFYAFFANNSGQPLMTDIWAKIIYPDSVTERSFWGPITEILQMGTTGHYRNQYIPGSLPSGDHRLIFYVGVHPGTIWSSDTLKVSKEEPGGTELWVARYGGNGWVSDAATRCITDAAKNVYVTGRIMGGTANEFNYGTIKYDSYGNRLWVAIYSGPGHQWDGANSLAVDDFGNIYVAGRSMGSGSSYDYATIKYDPNGNQMWVARYNGLAGLGDGATDLALDGTGNIYVTGWSTEAQTGKNYCTIKYDGAGNQIWLVQYNGSANGDDMPYAIATDFAGNVYVTGYSDEIGTSLDCTTLKYDSNGNQNWIVRYNGPLNNADYGLTMTLDISGNIYVTGGSWGTNYDFITLKYNTQGIQIWEACYNGPGNLGDEGQAIAVDGEGNVYVTGESFGIGTDADYATVKYDCDGNQIWMARYNGPGNDWDKSTSIAVDGDANVYVTGWSFGSGSYGDYTTIKYDSHGNQVWLAQYNGPGNGDDYSFCLALSIDSDVYVTGQSFGNETHYDYCTIRYSGGNLDNWLPVEATVLGQPLPRECRLEGNYPNPFNASTVLRYRLPVASHVRLEVFDISGRAVAVGAQHAAPLPLVDGWRSAGTHEMTFDASHLPSGMYFARLEAGDYLGVQKLVLLK